MLAFAAALFVFLTCAAAAALLLRLGGARRPSFDERVRALRSVDTGRAEEPAATRLPRRRLASMPQLRRWLEESDWAKATRLALRQAGVPLRPSEYLAIRLLLALAGLAVPLLLFQNQLLGVLSGLAAGGFGYAMPALYLKSARGRRIARIEKQLIEFLPALASSLRSGFTFQPAVETALQQVGPPLNDEFTAVLHDMTLGASMATALRDLGQRVGSVDLDMVITAVLVQRTTGGNLPEILDHTAEALRDRERVRGEVRTFTAQQRLTGLILSIYPVAVGLVLLALMPAIWSKLFTEPAGQAQLAVALGLQALGFLGIQRALRIDV